MSSKEDPIPWPSSTETSGWLPQASLSTCIRSLGCASQYHSLTDISLNQQDSARAKCILHGIDGFPAVLDICLRMQV